jgi:hypothetical protein
MKLGELLALAGAGALVFACSSTTTTTTAPPGGNGNGNGDGTVKPADDDDDPANQPPHSLGVISLGESHASGSSTSAPIVSATFYPDAMLTKRCTTPVAGCEVFKAPKCTQNKSTPTGCNTDSYCTLDEQCNAVCKKTATCTKTCKTDEVCKVDDAGKASCVKKESFDAGPIAFSGTTTPITLYPPYKFESDAKGAPFLAGAEIQVQAQGATAAGFEAFDEKFTATTFLQTTPSLKDISGDVVFGTGAIPIAWAPGKDRIYVSVSGAGGSAQCKVADSAGKFDIPRELVNAVIGDLPEGSTPNLTITVTRSKKDTKKDKKAKGELSSTQVIADAWLDLVTSSSESQSYRGCAKGLNACGTECVDLKTDNANCGACDNACTGSLTCSNGKCVGSAEACDSCTQDAAATTCASQASACNADAECTALLQCAANCATQACVNTCVQQHPNGQSKAVALQQCLRNACSSVCN